jgi:hypothetical protein
MYLFNQFLEMLFNFGYDLVFPGPISNEEQMEISEYECPCQNFP